MNIPHDAVVLVADGRKLLVFRNEGDEKFLDLKVEHREIDVNPPHHEQATDLAGQSRPGSDMDEVDFHQQEEDRFAAAAADMLNARALRNEFDALVVVAPPRALGALRKHFHKEVERRLVGELSKDLVNVPVGEIEQILKAH